MNLQQVKQKLDRVNQFYAYLESNQDSISRVDRDAFLNAIRMLYDACFDTPTVDAVVAPVVKKEVPKPTPKTEEPLKKKRPKLVFNDDNGSSNTKQKEATPPAKKPEEKPVETPKAVVKTPTPPKEEVKEPVKQATPPPSTPDEPESAGFNEEFEELFLFKEATDLSQKLSASPIDDLKKALGVNEKFLYINELFGGNVNQFNSAISELNKGEDFDQARAYMEKELVESNEWMKKTKKTVAKDFIKLVRRRYL